MAYMYPEDRTDPKGSPENPLTSADYPRIVGLRAGVDQRKSDFLESLAREEAFNQNAKIDKEMAELEILEK